MGAAHKQRIVHRDLKPGNVLVTTSQADADVTKVLDFGLAKMAAIDEADGGGLTRPGVVMGTVGYMAPEQLTAGDIDERCDVFALGVMAAEATTGRRPFRGRTHEESLAAIRHEPLRLEREGPEWRRLEAVLQRAVAADRSDRHRSVATFIRDLLPALRTLSHDAVTAAPDAETTAR